MTYPMTPMTPPDVLSATIREVPPLHDVSWVAMVHGLLENLLVPFEKDVPLGPMTWYGVGGPATALARPISIFQLSELMRRAKQVGVPVYVLGSGANLLVRDCGVHGIVLRLDREAFSHCTIEGTFVNVGAGHDLFELINEMARKGLAGLEVLSGIPASVGGAIRMNAGGTFGAIGPLVHGVHVMYDDGATQWLTQKDIVFSYRHSNITAPIILEAKLQLTKGEPKALKERVKEIMQYKKSVQPMGERSAGCAFKNPAVAPLDPATNKPYSAGKLIDMTGLKGFRIGSASVSTHHANFVLADNKKEAHADDVLAVIEHARAEVLKKFNVTLESEVAIWP